MHFQPAARDFCATCHLYAAALLACAGLSSIYDLYRYLGILVCMSCVLLC